MWRSIYFVVGVLVARWIFRRPSHQIDLVTRLRNAGF
jgi:hypothetical protein